MRRVSRRAVSVAQRPGAGGARSGRQERAPETGLRRALGIPGDAPRVLVLAESTHWDPDWLATSEGYWRWRVRRTLGRAIEECLAEQRRVFDVECVFFLRMYWERVPHHRDAIVELLNAGRLRMTGSGITTPDTTLPDVEALLRDFLLGQVWLRSVGVEREPTMAYFPDNFGHSPGVPALLRSMGVDRTAITRIDGMYFVGCDWELPSAFPRPGSSAELLERERTLDFVWRSPDGSEVLCHWNAFGYGQGELLAHSGVTRVMGWPLAVPNRTEPHVARRVAEYAARLAPLSRTPYLLCPVGFDFSMPIPGLVGLCDRYNARRYPDTGTWVVNAGLDDYLALVDTHRAELPVLELDPNPYWTGFYSARPSLKQQAHDLVEALVDAELDADRAGPATRRAARDQLGPAWDVAVTANHHDFVTGTSPDRVHDREQVPWLDGAQQAVAQVRRSLGLDDGAAPAVKWTEDPPGGDGGPLRGELVLVADGGGLWRMGHEFRGGRWEELGPYTDRADAPARWFTATPAASTTVGAVTRRRIELAAPERTTVLLRIDSELAGDTIDMDVPGAVVARPRSKVHDPTYWCASSFVHVRGADGSGLAVLVPRATAVSVSRDGRIDLVAARNAPIERAWGWLPIPGHPARGTEPGPVVFEYALVATTGGDWQANRLAPPAAKLFAARRPRTGRYTVDRDDVWVRAVKEAHRGDGAIVRLRAPGASRYAPVDVTLRGTRPIAAAWVCDARERDVAALPGVDGTVTLRLDGPIASIRVLEEPGTGSADE
ncbi:MAG: hypothetical protein U0V73_10295 [Acidimicrobiia bacterium]